MKPLLLFSFFTVLAAMHLSANTYLLNPVSSSRALHGPFPEEQSTLATSATTLPLPDGRFFILQSTSAMSVVAFKPEVAAFTAPRSQVEESMLISDSGLRLTVGQAEEKWTAHQLALGAQQFTSSSNEASLLALPDGSFFCEGLTLVKLTDAKDWTLQQSRNQNYGILSPPDGEQLKAPSDWLWLREGDTAGFAVVPAAGTRLRASEQGWSAVGSPAQFYILPAADEAAAWQATVSALPSVLLEEDTSMAGYWQGIFTEPGRSLVVEVWDRNADQIPDTLGDLWSYRSPMNPADGLLVAFSKESDGARRLAIFTRPEGTDPTSLIRLL